MSIDLTLTRSDLLCGRNFIAGEWCAGREWLHDGRVRKISFTGSTPTGKYLARESIDTLKKISLELGGNAPFIYEPTVLGNATPEMALNCEETFGPVVPLFRFSSEDEVVQRANDTPYGLAAYFYSRNLKRIWRLAANLEVGIVDINKGVVASEAAPFGGIKESGYGREGSRYGLDDYLQIKYLYQGNLR